MSTVDMSGMMSGIYAFRASGLSMIVAVIAFIVGLIGGIMYLMNKSKAEASCGAPMSDECQSAMKMMNAGKIMFFVGLAFFIVSATIASGILATRRDVRKAYASGATSAGRVMKKVAIKIRNAVDRRGKVPAVVAEEAGDELGDAGLDPNAAGTAVGSMATAAGSSPDNASSAARTAASAAAGQPTAARLINARGRLRRTDNRPCAKLAAEDCGTLPDTKHCKLTADGGCTYKLSTEMTK